MPSRSGIGSNRPTRPPADRDRAHARPSDNRYASMGLFSKKKSEPIVHPAVHREIFVRAEEQAVRTKLDEYSSLFSPKRTVEHDLQLSVSGGWVAVQLPDAVHPWQLHNLAYWLLDCDHPESTDGVSAEVIAVSEAAPTHPGYRLVRDDEVPDALCGWDDAGDGWTVQVPGNDIVTPEDVPVARSLTVPSGFHTWYTVGVRLEDPGHDMNPANESTFPSRKRLRERHHLFMS